MGYLFFVELRSEIEDIKILEPYDEEKEPDYFGLIGIDNSVEQ